METKSTLNDPIEAHFQMNASCLINTPSSLLQSVLDAPF